MFEVFHSWNDKKYMLREYAETFRSKIITRGPFRIKGLLFSELARYFLIGDKRDDEFDSQR